jgi:hypothetical protein
VIDMTPFHPLRSVLPARACPLLILGALALGLVGAPRAQAGVTIAPYVSVKSTKSIKPNAKDKSQENETVAQRKEAGLRASLSMGQLFSLQFSAGQNKLTTTQKTQDAKDEYGDIDYQKDLNLSTDAPDTELKITETQRNGKVSLVFDPSFSIFILRAKAGVTATQRILETEETGKDKMTLTAPPTYKPHSGFGVGIRFSPSMYAMAEYNFLHYKFPKVQPFEREVAVSFALSI